MIDIYKTNYIAHFVNIESIDMVGVATDTFFQEKPNSSYQIQISDIDIEFNMNYANLYGGIVPLDVGGIALTTELKQSFLKTGCSSSLFRKMTVEGEPDLLHQLITPACFKLINQNLPVAPDSKVYRGVLDDIDIQIQYLKVFPFGCFDGRENYQEIFFLGSFFDQICQISDISKWTIPLPLYDDILFNIKNEEWDSITEDADRFKNEKNLSILRKGELFFLLECAVHVKNKFIGEKVYNCLKSRPLPMAEKKNALLLYKKISI